MQKKYRNIIDSKLGVGTPSKRYENNIAAIRLLKSLENEKRFATTGEQEILSRYVGWGGLSDCFDKGNAKYFELKSLMSDDEYDSAKASTLTAFFTPPTVIKAMYKALVNMGFIKGSILDPACGTGNFFGLIPDDIECSKMYGVELDSISGRIARQLYRRSVKAAHSSDDVSV